MIWESFATFLRRVLRPQEEKRGLSEQERHLAVLLQYSSHPLAAEVMKAIDHYESHGPCIIEASHFLKVLRLRFRRFQAGLTPVQLEGYAELITTLENIDKQYSLMWGFDKKKESFTIITNLELTEIFVITVVRQP